MLAVPRLACLGSPDARALSFDRCGWLMIGAESATSAVLSAPAGQCVQGFARLAAAAASSTVRAVAASVPVYHASALESAGCADGAYLSQFPVSIDGDA
jgi:hypothetical protein